MDFGAPFFRNVAEIVVTGPASPGACVDRGSRRTQALRAPLVELLDAPRGAEWAPARAGPPAIELKAAPEDLQDDDLLEMLNAGLVGLAVVDRYKATTWARVSKRIKPRDDLKVHEGGDIALDDPQGQPAPQGRGLRVRREARAGQRRSARTWSKKYTGGTRFVRGRDLAGRSMRSSGRRWRSSASTATATRWTTC